MARLVLLPLVCLAFFLLADAASNETPFQKRLRKDFASVRRELLQKTVTVEKRKTFKGSVLINDIEHSKLPRPTSSSSKNSTLPSYPAECTGAFRRETLTGTVLFNYNSISPFFCCFVCSTANNCKASMFDVDTKLCTLYSEATQHSCTDCRNLCTMF